MSTCPPGSGYVIGASGATCTPCDSAHYSTSENSQCLPVPANARRTLDGTYFICNSPLVLSSDGQYCTSLNTYADPLELTTLNINQSLSATCPPGVDSNTCAIQNAHSKYVLPLLYTAAQPVKIDSYLFPTQVTISSGVATLESNSHGLSTNTHVHLSDFGNSSLNGGPFSITTVDSNNFTIPTTATGTSTVGTVTVDGLPTDLLSNLASCVSNNNCNYLGYDFLTNNVHKAMNLNYIVDTRQTGSRDASVFIKSGRPQATLLSSPPGYTYISSMLPYQSTEQEVPNIDIDACANKCNETIGCLGFNHDDLLNICQLVKNSLQIISGYSSNYIGYSKEVINHYTITGADVSLSNLSNEGSLCMDYRQCNFDMNVLVYSNVGTFTTNDLMSCAYCPLRSYERTGTMGNGDVTNELGTVSVNPDGLLTQLMFQAGTFTVPYLVDGGYTMSPWIPNTHTGSLSVFVYHNLLYYKDSTNKLFANIPLIEDKNAVVLPTTYVSKGYTLNVQGEGVVSLTETSPYYIIKDVDPGTSDYNHGIFIFTPRPDSVGSFFGNIILSNTYVTDSDGKEWSIRLGAPNFTNVSNLSTSINFSTLDPACQEGSILPCSPISSVFISDTTGLRTGSVITIKNQNFTVSAVRGQRELSLSTQYIEGVTSNINYSTDTIIQTSLIKSYFPSDSSRDIFHPTKMISFYNDIKPQSPLNVSSTAVANQILGPAFQVADMPDPYEEYGLFRSLYLSPRWGADVPSSDKKGCDQSCSSYVAYYCYVNVGPFVGSCDGDSVVTSGLDFSCGGTYKKCTPDKATLLNGWSRVYSNLIATDIFRGGVTQGINNGSISGSDIASDGDILEVINRGKKNSTDIQYTRWSTVYSIATSFNPDSDRWGQISITDANGNFQISIPQTAEYFYPEITMILSDSTSMITGSQPQKQYTISTTNGTSTFKLIETSGAGVSTTSGILTGVTFSIWQYGSIRNKFLTEADKNDFPSWSSGRFNNQSGNQNATGFLESTFGCPAGYYVMARNSIHYCQVCPAGTYSFGGHHTSACTPCTLGHYCQRGSTHDGPDCAPGYYCPDTSTQISCPAGYFCPQRTIFPISCDTEDTNDGTFRTIQVTAGSLAASLNVSVYDYSTNPTFLPGTIASLTPLLGSLQLLSNTLTSAIFTIILNQTNNVDGSVRQTLKYHTSAHYCPIGSSSPKICAGSNYCPFSKFQIPCSSGNYCPVGVYKGYLCPPNTYYRAPQLTGLNVAQLNADGSHCYNCPIQPGTTTRYVVNAAQDGCVCPDPFTWSLEQEVCVLNCPPGKFANMLSNTCQWCPDGTFSENLGTSNACVQCPDNFNSQANAAKTGCTCTNTRHDGNIINGVVVWNNTYNRCQLTSCNTVSGNTYSVFWSDCVANTYQGPNITTYTCKDVFNQDMTSSSLPCYRTETGYCEAGDWVTNGMCVHDAVGAEAVDMSCDDVRQNFSWAPDFACTRYNCRSGYTGDGPYCWKNIPLSYCPPCFVGTGDGQTCMPDKSAVNASCYTCPATNSYVPSYDTQQLPHTSINDFIENPTLPLTFPMGLQTNGVPDTLGMYFQYNSSTQKYTRKTNQYTPSDSKITDLIELAGVLYATGMVLRPDIFQLLTKNSQTIYQRYPDLTANDARKQYAALKAVSNLLERGETSVIDVGTQLYSSIPLTQGKCQLLRNLPASPSLWGKDGSTPQRNDDGLTAHNLLLALRAVFTGTPYSTYFNIDRDGGKACHKGINCMTGSNCSPGYYCGALVGGSQELCPPGYYCPEGTSEPFPCLTSGTYCPWGSSASITCPAGSYCPNTVSNIYCPGGTYNSYTGRTNRSDCLTSPDGSYAVAGATSSTLCVSGSYCPAGTSNVNPLCPEGKFCPNTSTMLPCPASYNCPKGSTWSHSVCNKNQQNVYDATTRANTCVNCPDPAEGQIWDSSYWLSSSSPITFPLTNSTTLKINARASENNTSTCLLKTVVVSNVASGAKFSGVVGTYTPDNTMNINDITAFSGNPGTYSGWLVNLAGCDNVINCTGHSTNNSTWTTCTMCPLPTLSQMWTTNTGCLKQSCPNGAFSSLISTSTTLISYPIRAPLRMDFSGGAMSVPFQVGSQVLVYNSYNTSFVGTVSFCDDLFLYFNEITHVTLGPVGHDSWSLQQYGCA